MNLEESLKLTLSFLILSFSFWLTFSRWNLYSKLIAYVSMSWENRTSLPCNHFLSSISGYTGMEGRMIVVLPALAYHERNVHLIRPSKYLYELGGEGKQSCSNCIFYGRCQCNRIIESLLGIYPDTFWPQPCAQKLDPWFWLMENSNNITNALRNGDMYYLNKNPRKF